MMLKRFAAIALAVALITGAFVIRDRFIDGDTADADEPVNAGVIICASELSDVCRAVVGDRYVVVSEPAGETLDRLAAGSADPVLWLTFDAFPQMMNTRRGAAGVPAFEYTATDLASSNISVVVRPDTTDELVTSCGDPIDLGCVGEQTQLNPAVSAVDDGLGLLAVSAAFAARTDEPISFDDVDLLAWARGFHRASERVTLSGSAVETIQTKTSVAVALGVEAELSPSRVDQFDVLYAAPMALARVVLLKPSGFDVATDFVTELGDALVTRGWDEPAASDPDAFPSPTTMIGIREFWSGLS